MIVEKAAERRGQSARMALGDHRTSLGIVAFHEVPQLDGILFVDSGSMSTISVLTSEWVQITERGDTAGHAGGEVPPDRAEHGDGAAGHVLAAVVADAFDHRDRSGVADSEPLAHPATEKQLPPTSRRRAWCCRR